MPSPMESNIGRKRRNTVAQSKTAKKNRVF